MAETLLALLVLPWLFALLQLVLPRPSYAVTGAATGLLTLLALAFWAGLDGTVAVETPAWLGALFAGADIVLLLYFARQGQKSGNKPVLFLAVGQLVLLGYLLTILPHGERPDILADRLSAYMLLLINAVGGLITLFAVRYMADEEGMSDARKTRFTAILLWFLGIMNFIVVADNIEWFFLLFETTTLASYLLIRYRMDEESVANALRALWMNQVGGVAILVGSIGLIHLAHTIHFSHLIEMEPAGLLLLPVAFFLVAAMVKGAQIPFDKWLLGAMVAPTPVSAILHSSTMVKIAPFLALKLSPAIQGTPLAAAMIVAGGFVFFAAGAEALGKNRFKLVLAHSTIALLGLMMMLAAVGTPLAVTASLAILMFHGVAKALLFLQAGMIEKSFHAKEVEAMAGLVEKSPYHVYLIFLGFATLTLPPFGAFIGKWMAVEALPAASGYGLAMLVGLVLLALGSVILVLLYFKALGRLLVRSDENDDAFHGEKIFMGYTVPLSILGAILVVTAFLVAPFTVHVAGEVTAYLTGHLPMQSRNLGLIAPETMIPFWQIGASMLLLLAAPWLAVKLRFTGADKAKPYACGEKLPAKLSAFYFFDDPKTVKFHGAVGAGLFLLVLLAGGAA